MDQNILFWGAISANDRFVCDVRVGVFIPLFSSSREVKMRFLPVFLDVIIFGVF